MSNLSDPTAKRPALAEQLLELSTLTGGLAHEIRNPLSTLKVNLQLLDEDWRQVESPSPGQACDPQEVARRSRKRIATLLEESKRLERILQDFLQYVGKRELRLGAHDLNEVVAGLADFFLPQTQVHGIEMEVALAEEPLLCMLDPAVFKQAVLNLMINAQQAMSDGGRMALHTSAEGELARLDVIDTGPGIAPGDQQRVFEAYYSTKKGGTGLGLATTRRIVQEHGGSVEVHSEGERGSRFTILLPRMK